MKALGRWFRGAGALGIAFGLVAACGSDSTEDKRVLAELSQGCVLNSDCKSPLVCVFRKCHEQCTETRDCPDGLLCVAADEDSLRVCQLPTETKCYSTHDCPGKQVCGPDGRCRDFCDSPSRTPTRVWSRRAMGVGGGIHDGEQGPEVTGRDGDRAGSTKEEVKWVDYL